VRGERSIAMQNVPHWLFPTSLFVAWTLTTAYTITLIAGRWVA
jgi:hypothetical protein